MAHTIRDAIIEKTEILEKKFREEQDIKKIPIRVLPRLGQSPLGPSAPKPIDDNDDNNEDIVESQIAAQTVVAAPAAPADPLADVYEHHAQRVFEALADPIEKRVRIEEALAAIQEEYPIIAPLDDVIRTKLQDVVQRLRAASRAATAKAAAYPPSPYATYPTYPVVPPVAPSLSPSRFQSPLTGRTFR
jgi:hypothetical protein